MSTLVEGLFQWIFNIMANFIDFAFSPLNQLLQPVLAGILASEQLLNFYNVINTYVLPSTGFFVNIVPPKTWLAIEIGILFYISIFGVVLAMYFILKILRIIKNIVPFA